MPSVDLTTFSVVPANVLNCNVKIFINIIYVAKVRSKVKCMVQKVVSTGHVCFARRADKSRMSTDNALALLHARRLRQGGRQHGEGSTARGDDLLRAGGLRDAVDIGINDTMCGKANGCGYQRDDRQRIPLPFFAAISIAISQTD
ncbi:hypothetical protein DFJ58DRAFT_847500 [Suillus subalutaceus]|uniref:uncharacterized protein n=1 Tax=Suillus subalutaceus TaxID=48586 RepID=UPI001B8734C3|nr:uncharacterized protein DFJ58DRAFT_847500 [Suillus subalutaceus]KAG1834970.1 hypothetical protein DFJ58DRAFT_847500 [Suillus subalutaceus]